MESIHSIKIVDHGYEAQAKSTASIQADGNGVNNDTQIPVPNSLSLVPAVVVRDAVKRYGSTNILKNLDMTVQQGQIYSLLGSSGCGKTTLLTCILGTKKLRSGTIEVFGFKSGSRESGVPGSLVGYMPQEAAVYKAFSIRETFQYFGSLNGMTNKAIKEQTDSLIKLLELPTTNRKVGTLSGGQSRRLSLAVALIHVPRLIILDEPTVGVDPLLRERIWKYLTEYVKLNGSTVIITTHYIDEARHSNTVGVMRAGKILTEETPQVLYVKYNTTVLEDIVLKLCYEDEMKGNNISIMEKPSKLGPADNTGNLIGDGDNPLPLPSKDEEVQNQTITQQPVVVVAVPKQPKKGGCCQNLCSDVKSSVTRICALTKKNAVVTIRNYWFMGFLMTFPSLIMVPLIMAIAGGPRNLNIAVVNLELDAPGKGCNSTQLHPKSCVMEKLSCVLLGQFPKDAFTLTYMKNEAAAIKGVKDAKYHSMLVFPKDFTSSLKERYLSTIIQGPVQPNQVNTTTMKSTGELRIRNDESNPIIGRTLRVKITEKFFVFLKKLKALCIFIPQDLVTVPYKFGKPIHGTKDGHKVFATSGFLLGFVYFFGNISCALNLLWDKNQGTKERAQVNGVKTWEIILAQGITESILIIIQVSLFYFVLIVVYKSENEGSHFLAWVIFVLSGIMGNAHGFLWATITDQELDVELLSMGAYFPGYFLSGLNFPIESFPKWLQIVAYILPTTLPSESLRSIMFRGMDLSYSEVYLGLVVPLSWISFMIFLSLLVQFILDKRR